MSGEVPPSAASRFAFSTCTKVFNASVTNSDALMSRPAISNALLYSLSLIVNVIFMDILNVVEMLEYHHQNTTNPHTVETTTVNNQTAQAHPSQ